MPILLPVNQTETALSGALGVCPGPLDIEMRDLLTGRGCHFQARERQPEIDPLTRVALRALSHAAHRGYRAAVYCPLSHVHAIDWLLAEMGLAHPELVVPLLPERYEPPCAIALVRMLDFVPAQADWVIWLDSPL